MTTLTTLVTTRPTILDIPGGITTGPQRRAARVAADGRKMSEPAANRMSAFAPKQTYRVALHLLGVKRTCAFALQMSAFRAKQTFKNTAGTA
jgi:hypothetical protein